MGHDRIDFERRWLVLITCCMSVLLVGIDTTAVNVALPSIGRDFGVGVGGLSWIIDAYTVTLAALLMFSASTGDWFGRKRMFLIGLTVFLVGSRLCAVAPNLDWLIAFRIVQAVGGSMLNPIAMAIPSNAFPVPAERAKAIGVWAGVTGLSLAVRPIAGGALVGSNLGWRWIFVINIPIGLLAVAITLWVVPEFKATIPRRSDFLGQAMVMGLLGALTYGIIEGGRSGWSSPVVLVSFIVAVGSLAGILIYEPRRKQPLLQLGFFKSVPSTGANLIAILSFAALGAFLFLNSLYLQEDRRYSPLHAGLLITPVAIVGLVYGPINGVILSRYGVRPCLLTGGAALALGGLMLTGIHDTTSTAWLLAAYALIGVANAAIGAPITHTAVAGMPPSQAGPAAGISSTSRQIGTTLGVAIASATLGATATSAPFTALGSRHSRWLVAQHHLRARTCRHRRHHDHQMDRQHDIQGHHRSGKRPHPSLSTRKIHTPRTPPNHPVRNHTKGYTMTSHRVAIIVGSTRPARISSGIATWLLAAIQRDSQIEYEIVELAEIDLPLLDEPLMAALQQYQHAHTRAWSELVSGYDGFLFVFPQYNWGYPAALKNALDYLYREWRGKPVSFLTFGTHGGDRAAVQLDTVLHGLRMQVLPDRIEAVITEEDLDEDWQLKDVDATLGPCLEQVTKVGAQMTAAFEAELTAPMG